MNLIDILIIVTIGIYVLSCVYKGFIWSASTFCSSLLACIVAFLLMGTVADSIIENQSFYDAMLSYTEGSESVYDVEYAKKEITELSNEKINEIMDKSNLPHPLRERVYDNIMMEAFKDKGIVKLGDYFNESIVRVIINIIAFMLIYLIIRITSTFIICWLDYSIVFPKLRKADAVVGGAIGILRGIIAISIIFMMLPVILTVLPFDSIRELVDSSGLATLFYESNIFLRFIPGV